MTATTDLRSLSVQDHHRMVVAEILAAAERVELIEGRLAFSNCGIAMREFLRLGEQR